ncbi:MAG: tetratricopeptide repeat protein [Phycisphaerales bacterium]|nr:MAG: tetratricopeptide repeat protein [Phycisphaerales bacterium]
MIAGPQTRKRGRFRVGWLVAVVVVVVAGGIGAYALYVHQRDRNTERLRHAAEQYVAEGDWEKAAVSYRQYLRRRDSDRDALSAYADVLIERVEKTPEVLGDTVRVLRRLVDIDPENTDALSKLTDLYLSLREFSLAESLATRWVGLAPDSEEATLSLALAYHGLGRSDDAVETLTQALAASPTKARLYPPLVQLLSTELEKPDDAMEWLEKGLSVAADSYEVQMAAFDVFQRQGKIEIADKHLRQAVEVAPQNAHVLTRAAVFCTSQNQLDRADDLLAQAERLASGTRRLLLARSAWAIKKDDPQVLADAAAKLQAHAKEDEFDLIAQAADLFLRAGLVDRADECMEKLAGVPEDNERLRGWISALKGTRALLDGRPFTAIPHLETALREQPANPRVTQKLAQAFLKIGSTDMAAVMYRRASVLSSDPSKARLALARIQLDRGQTDLARATVGAISNADDVERFQVDVIRAACNALDARAGRLPPGDPARKEMELGMLAGNVPEDSASIELLAECLLWNDQKELAVRTLRNGMDALEDCAELGDRLGRILLADEDFQAAESLAELLIGRHPQSLAGYKLKIRILAARDTLPEAQTHVSGLTLNDSMSGRLWEALANANADAGQLEPALHALRNAVALIPNDIAVLQKLARLTPQRDEALALVEAMRNLEGEAGLHWKYDRAWALMRTDETNEAAEEAVELLEECLIGRPGWVSVRLLLGDAQYRLGLLQRAADSYRSAIAQRSELASGAVALKLVHILKQLDRFGEADTVLNALADAHPDEPEILRLKTEQHYRTRNLASAAASAKRLLDINPDDAAWAALTADLYRRSGDPAKAEQIAGEALQRNGSVTSLLWALAQSLIDQRRPDEALALIHDAAKSHKGGLHTLLLARVLAQLGQDSRARETLIRAVESDPENHNVLAGAADVWMTLGNRARQLECARRAIELQGQDPRESLALATLLAQRGGAEDQEEAGEIVQRRLANSPDDPRALVLQGRLAMQASPPDLVKAELSLSQALAVSPRSARAHELLAAVELRRGRLDAARDTISAGLAFAPYDPNLLLGSAEIHSTRGEYERALPPLLRLLDIAPRNLAALQLLASAYTRSGQVNRAIDFVETHIPPELHSPAEVIILAKLYEARNDLDRASAMFRSAVADDENSAESHQAYLRHLDRRGAFDEIRKLAISRLETHPNDVESLMLAGHVLGSKAEDTTLRDVGMRWLETVARDHADHASDALYRSALCYYARGELGRAESKYIEALRLEPKNGSIINDLAWLYAEELHRSAEAVAIIERFLAGGGVPDAHILDTYGLALSRLGRTDAARQQLTACLRIAGETSTRTAATYHLGRLLLDTGQTREGWSYLREAVELNDKRGGLSPGELEEARRILESARSEYETP